MTIRLSGFCRTSRTLPLAVHPPSACSGVKALRNTSDATAASRQAPLAFRSLDPFRALREPDRRRRDEERPFPVGSRTGAPVGRGIPTVPRFQPPPRRTQHADFPHCAPPFASLQGVVCVKFSKLVMVRVRWFIQVTRAASLCSIGNDHPFVPTCPPAERRAQRQSRMPPRTRRHRRSRRAACLTERARC